jgi:hypothetical protein
LPSGLDDHLAERDEFVPARRGAAPRQADGAHRRRRLERHHVDALAITDLDRQGQLGQDRAAITVGHHLDHGGEAARPKIA